MYNLIRVVINASMMEVLVWTVRLSLAWLYFLKQSLEW